MGIFPHRRGRYFFPGKYLQTVSGNGAGVLEKKRKLKRSSPPPPSCHKRGGGGRLREKIYEFAEKRRKEKTRKKRPLLLCSFLIEGRSGPKRLFLAFQDLVLFAVSPLLNMAEALSLLFWIILRLSAHPFAGCILTQIFANRTDAISHMRIYFFASWTKYLHICVYSLKNKSSGYKSFGTPSISLLILPPLRG